MLIAVAFHGVPFYFAVSAFSLQFFNDTPGNGIQ
jgi:hypothetical protein